MELEDLHRVVVQGFASLNDKIDSVESRLGDVESRLSGRLDRVETRLGSVETRLGSVETGLGSVESRLCDRIDSLQNQMNVRFGRVDHDLALVKEAVMEHGRQLKDVRATLDKKVDRDEVEAIVERVVARGAGH